MGSRQRPRPGLTLVPDMDDTPEVLDLMLEQSRTLTWEPRSEGWTTHDAYEEVCGAVFREFEPQIDDDLRTAFEDTLEVFEMNAGFPLAEVDPEAAVVAKGSRALAGYIVLFFQLGQTISASTKVARLRETEPR